MNRSYLTEEQQRISLGVASASVPPELISMRVASEPPAHEYIQRIRSVLRPAVILAQQADFESEVLPENSIPLWFSEASKDKASPSHVLDGFAARGAQRYVSRFKQAPWELQEWLFCFDPDRRSWAWWDATVESSGATTLWLDTQGEATVAWDDFIWLAYVAGAQSVEEATLRKSSEWYAAKQTN